MKGFVGVTDNDWFVFLSKQAGIDEVNFWQLKVRGSPIKGQVKEKNTSPGKKVSFFAWPQRPHQHGLVLASLFAPVTSVSLVLVKH